MNLSEFVKAWGDVRTPPCEKCRFRQHCAETRTACELWARNYIGIPGFAKLKNAERKPSQHWYDVHFTDRIGYVEKIHKD